MEDKKAAKEKRRQIEEANRLLVAAPRKSGKSMGLISFDPTGTFHFEGERWIKVYEVTGGMGDIAHIASEMDVRIRVSIHLIPLNAEIVKKKTYISLIATGENYEEIRRRLSSYEKVLMEMIGVRPLSVDEAIGVILNQFCGREKAFTYASFVRSKKDLLPLIAPDIVEHRDYFQIEGKFGMSMFAMEYPKTVRMDVMSLLEKLGCPVFITFDLVGISDLNRDDYIRTLERRYSKTLSDSDIERFMNVSAQLTFICDSMDALLIVKKTLDGIFSKAGYLISAVYGAQKESFISQITLGFLNYSNFRNVNEKFIKELFRREYGCDKDKIRTDKSI